MLNLNGHLCLHQYNFGPLQKYCSMFRCCREAYCPTRRFLSNNVAYREAQVVCCSALKVEMEVEAQRERVCCN